MKEKKFQFSKMLVTLINIFSIAGIGCVLYLATLYGLDSTVSASAIAACGCITSTSVLFSLKKAQAENTMKIYLGTYKNILELKKENGEDGLDILMDAETNMLDKVNTTLNNSIDEATSPIERQDII